MSPRAAESRRQAKPPITLRQLEAATGLKAKDWAGSCYAIACAAAKLISGAVAIYGHWTGPTVSGSIFAGRLVVQHGWVLLRDGRVLDPTRWEFEQRKPYIYCGPSDYYDEGGNKFRMAMQGDEPPPFDPCDRVYHLDSDVLPTSAWNYVERLLRLDQYYGLDDYEVGSVSSAQLFYVANIDPRKMEGHAKAIYDMLEKLYLLAAMPIDNQLMIEQGRA